MTFNNKEYIQWKKARRNKRIGLRVALTALGVGGGIGIGYGIWYTVSPDSYLNVKYDVSLFKWDEEQESSLPIVKGNISNKTAKNLDFSFSDHSEIPSWLSINKTTGQLSVSADQASEETEYDANQWFTIPIDVKGKIGSRGKTITGHCDAKIHISNEETYILTDFFHTHSGVDEINFYGHKFIFSGGGYNGGGTFYSIPLYNTSDPQQQTSENIVASIDKYKNGGNHFYGIRYKTALGATTWTPQHDFASGKSGENWYDQEFLISNNETCPDWIKATGAKACYPSLSKPFREYENLDNPIDSKFVQDDNGPFDQTVFHEWIEVEPKSAVPSVLKTEQTVNKVANNIYIPTKTKESE